MALNSKSDIISKYRKELNQLTSSKFCVYKNPTNLYENIINTLAVSRQQRRKGLFELCPLESAYKDWKERKFPEDEIVAEILKACKKLDELEQSRKPQIKITSFFKKQTSIADGTVNDARESDADKESDNDASENDAGGNDEKEESLSANTPRKVSNGLKRLYEILEIKGGVKVATKVDASENINIVSNEVNHHIEAFIKKDRQLTENALYFQQNSQLSNKKQEASEIITIIKTNLENLRDYTVAMSSKEVLSEKTIAQASKYVAHCAEKCSELEKEITQNLLNLKQVLQDLNVRISKRLSNIKAQKREDEIEITSENSDKTWTECMDLVEAVEMGLFKFSVEDFERTKNYFSWLARSKHEYSSPADLLEYLGRSIEDTKPLVQAIVKYLPIICVKLKNQTIFLDAEQFFGSAMKIVTFVDIMDTRNKVIEEEKNEKLNKSSIHGKESMKCPRKPGSGRPSWIEKRPDIVDSVKDFSSTCGVMAQERRREITGKMGFGIPDVHRFIQQKFFPNAPENSPSQATLRRFFCASSKANKASKFYKGIIKAKPCTTRNDATVGNPHKHRHHAFTTVKAIREFSSKHEEESVIISADDKCKLPIGPPVVSRLVKSRKFFVSGNEPNLPDHDVRSGLLITPNGYMILEENQRVFTTFPTSSAKSMADEMEESDEDIENEEFEEVDLMQFVAEDFIDVTQFLDQIPRANNSPDDVSLREQSTSSNNNLGDQSFAANNNKADDSGEDFHLEPLSLPPSPCSPPSFSSNLNLDGTCSSSSDSDSSEFKPRRKWKRIVMNSDSESNSENDDQIGEPSKNSLSNVEPNKNDNRSESDAGESDAGGGEGDAGGGDAGESDAGESDADESDENEETSKYRIIQDELGRNHISYPSTGKFYVFLKSHNFKPSTIQAHINDVVNIFEANEALSKKKVVTFIVDDGADYGIRSSSTLHFFGRLWTKLDLDLLAVVKNAPKDSKHNPVEHGWGFLTPKLAGVILPTKLEEDFDPSDGEDNLMEDSEHCDEKNTDVSDQGISIITRELSGLKYDGFDVVPVPVFCSSEDVNIEGKTYKNDYYGDEEAVRQFYDSSLGKERLRRRDPELLKEAKFYHKHLDKRSHCFFLRKCNKNKGEAPCKHCRKNPPRAFSDLWKDLHKRDSGGLFYGVEADPDQPGHNKTFLQLLKEKPKIVPDGDLDYVRRCQEKDCLYIFKSDADCERHMKIIHGKTGKEATPFGKKCTFVNGTTQCGMVFASQWYLTKHKKEEGHFIPRAKKGENNE